MIQNRRQFLQTGAAAAAALTAPAVLRGKSFAGERLPALPGLPTIDATRNPAFTIDAMQGETAFTAGVASPTLGFNRSYLGPVIRMRPGTEVAAMVRNRTRSPISVHWHGLLVRGEADGGPHHPIAPGSAWAPQLAIDQPPATLWYHAHLHADTAAQVYAGLAGVLIVDDGADAERGLPASADLDDLVLVLQDKRIDARGGAIYAPGEADLMHGFLGGTILVNGRNRPTIPVPRGIVRLRLVNAANARNFDLSLADRRPLVLIATDQGFLPEPHPVAALRLTPGERAEVLVDFGDGRPARLMSAPHAETAGTMQMGGMMHDMLPLPETFTAPFPVADFVVSGALRAAVKMPPAGLDADETPLPAPAITRRFVLNDMGMLPGGDMGAMGGHGGHGGPRLVFGINGQAFDMGRIDLQASLGATERWIVSSEMMGHPFHVHGVRFRVISENGAPPRPENQGWKDTVFVAGEAELLIRFDRPAAAETPFMFHCHILEHEDGGMMGQFAVG
jgi:FtsP/CotA-like multicopper oxidase with cupredoxin domain